MNDKNNDKPLTLVLCVCVFGLGYIIGTVINNTITDNPDKVYRLE